jgi:hypothetical protein
MSDHHPMFGSDPGPLNPDARPGFGKELSRLYSEWSNSHPDHSREEGQAVHQQIAAELTPRFPTYRELAK